ncbi:CheY-like chemotaxis protein/HPt (histidine-containing phosphotransfer) domain-containing protein [Azospirillum agricola]|uniref:response regulator n=1 Tax=Azospirillum agricola TaxID=1720247 RepID=UPI001AE5D3AE|nr:response regulator [Azospirillum agricola]MBP2229730.1 CheY-like chemotaxis protein/HPt (histidine-containing phosphotransfer) domain-containing protein [Azospirillum agricola]
MPSPLLPTEPEPAAPRRILVVEDSPLNQTLVTAILAPAGYRIETAGNGLEAVMAAQDGGFDLILMDVSMPEMDGLTATRLLRGLPGAAGRVPVVAMTADVGDGDRARCREAGMNDHVGKPIDRAQLLDTVARWLRPAAEREIPAPCAAAAADEDGGVLDPEVLTQLAQDLGAELLGEVLRQFVAETRERVERIAGLSDLALLTREAHTLKSTAGTFGARSLCAAARALEMACRDGAAAPAEALRGDIPHLAGEAIAAYRAAGYLD